MDEALLPDPSEELDRFIAAYEAAQVRDGQADLTSFLPADNHPLFREVLCELVRVELEFAWKRGQRPNLEAYLSRFPQLAEDRKILGEILFEEYRLRRQAGESPVPEDYQRRFGVDVADWNDRLPPTAKGWHGRLGAGKPSTDRPFALEAGPVSMLSISASPRDQTTTNLPEVGAQFLGFQLLAELGRGSFARVYLARQGELADRLVALKISSEPLGEPQLLAQLQHTNIVPIYSVHRAPPLYAVCMPFLGSATLAEVLRELRGGGTLPASGKALVATMSICKSKTLLAGRELPDTTDPDSRSLQVEQRQAQTNRPTASPNFAVCLKTLEGLSYVNAIVWLGARLADGLAHAHERGILHRDLKPANVLLSNDGQPMLLDFNLSEDTKLRTPSTSPFIGGTLPYMAPEHLAAFRYGERRLDARCDVYALGVILFELLTYRYPYPIPELPAEVMVSRTIDDPLHKPPRLRDHNTAVSPAVEAIIRRCLQPRPEQRYQTARQLQEDLERHLKDLPLCHIWEPSLRERAGKWARRHPRLMTFTSVAVVATIFFLTLSALFILRGERLTRLEAAESLQRFQEEVREAQTFFLEAPAASTERLEAIASACRRPLDRYGMIANSTWQEEVAVRYLSTDEKTRLQSDAGELLFLLAALARLQAHPDLEARQREALLRRAWEFNVQAGSCYEDCNVPGAVWQQRALLAQLLGHESEALRLVERAAEITPRRTRDCCMLACVYTTQGHFRKALPLWQKANQEDPQNVWTWCGLGSCYESLKLPSHAASCYTACIALHPDYHGWYFKRGLAHLRQGQNALALADFDRAVGLMPGHAESLVNRALAQLGVGSSAEAVTDLTRAIELGAADMRIYLIRAQAREQTGDMVGSAADRREAGKRAPVDDEGWVARGVRRAGEDLSAALADFDRALDVNPRSLPALESKAHVLAEKLGRTAEALQVLDRAVEFHSESPPIRAARAVLLARLGKAQAARTEAQEALSLDSSPQIAYQVSGAYALLSRQSPEDYQKALELLTSSLRQGYGHNLLETDRDLDALRDKHPFQELLQATRTLRQNSLRPTTRE
ncbi:MAG TPA: protein kinase [Gemmataceae bacterium]|jgi:serine/threonine protein kinase/Flp pilus assembly protein TadD